MTSGDTDAVSAALAAGANINERNTGGQTALILAVIFGHTNLVHLLVRAGADPRLRDNLGLDAVEWARRRGLTAALDLFTGGDRIPVEPINKIRVEDLPVYNAPPIGNDEKSRRWLAGIKQRIQEQGHKEAEPQITPIPEPASFVPEPAPFVPEPAPAPALVPAREPAPAPAPEPPFVPPPAQSKTPLLWIFVLVTLGLAGFTTYLITQRTVTPATPTTAAPQPSRESIVKGVPVARGDLAGTALALPEATCRILESATASQTVNVHLKVDKSGTVYWARAEGGDQVLRNAATEAATNSTFSPDKLRGRDTEGTITYTFTP